MCRLVTCARALRVCVCVFINFLNLYIMKNEITLEKLIEIVTTAVSLVWTIVQIFKTVPKPIAE